MTPILLAGCLFLLAIGLCELVRLISQRLGFVNRPAGERWNQRTVSLGGGIAITLTILAGIAWIGGKDIYVSLLPAVILVFGMGLIDDIWGVSPSIKLVVQTIAAAYVTGQGFVLPFHSPILGIAVSVIWIVGMTNAVNLVDNMDGLAGGVTVIAAGVLAFLLSAQQQVVLSEVALAVSAAAAGFLVHNFHPARIFMGDAGSLVLGFLLAALSTKLRLSSPIPSFLSIGLGCLVLVVPLFDTILVTVSRRNANRPISIGGRDHTSHRLVGLGMTERRATLFLYGLGLLGAAGAILATRAGAMGVMSIGVATVILLTLFGIFLLEIAVYPAPPMESFLTRKPGIPGLVQGHNSLPIPVLYLLEISIDVGAICLAWTAAHFIRFQDLGYESYREIAVIPKMPYVIAAKLVAFSMFKLYRGLWRTVMAHDVYRVFKATTMGTLLFLAGASLVDRLQDLSRIVVILDWMLTFLALLGTRAALGAFRRWTRYLSSAPCKTAFLGNKGLAPDVRRALEQEPAMEFSGVIAVDGSSGPDVLGPASELESLVADHRIDLLIVSCGDRDPRIAHLASRGVLIRELQIQVS